MNLRRKDLLTFGKSTNLAKIQLKKAAVNFGKIAVSILLLFFVFRKIPFRSVIEVCRHASFLYIFFAAVFFLLSQIVSVSRLQIFFRKANFNLVFSSQLELYFVGMFYNFFIPGGIGGDAYKVYLLNKKFSWKTKKLASALFCDRLSGLVAICLIISILALFSYVEFRLLIGFLLIIGMLIGHFIFKRFFSDFADAYWPALLYSLGVQLFQISCFIFLLKSIGIHSNFMIYALLFLASSVLSLISFAGIGVREMLFLQAAKYFEFSPQISVSASLLFTVITAIFSLLGVFFQLRKLNLKTENS